MKGYVATVAKRTAIDVFRRISYQRNNTEQIDDEIFDFGSDVDVEADSDVSEVRSILLREISALGEPDSTIIIQKYYFDRNSSEIAEMLSMKASAVRMRCRRAMSRLEDKLTRIGITL